MILTNKYNLPETFVKVVRESIYVKSDAYSATELLNPTRMIILQRRYDDEIEADVSDYIPQILGTGVHEAFERVDTDGDTEQRLEYEIAPNIKISGKYDKVLGYTLMDYKTTTVSKVQRGDFDDYKKQALIYAWLRYKNGMHTARAEFYVIMKDWSKMRRVNDPNYPETALYIWRHNIIPEDIIEIERYIMRKVNHIKEYEKSSDDKLPMCTDEERWYTGDSYAVMRQGGLRAIKVYDNPTDANNHIQGKNDLYVEARTGINIRCEHYCEVREYCPFVRIK